MKRLGIALMLVTAACLPPPRAHGAFTARLSYYESTGSPMASGDWPFAGAAACGADFAFGATVHVLGPDVTLVCLDRGWLAANQVDVFSEAGRPAWMVNDYEAVETW